MPVIKSAKKKLRQDKVKKEHNDKVRGSLRLLIKKARKNPTAETVRAVTIVVDKAAKHHIIHQNKAGHIKSALAKLLSGGKTPTPVKKAVKKSAVKKSPRKKVTSKTKK